MSVTVGQSLADVGAKSALLAKAVWSCKADIWLNSLESGFRITSEDLTNAIGFPDDKCPNANNAVGAKIRFWAHNKSITRIGFMKSTRSASHARMIALWEKL
jgi:hypothetical protein